MQAELKGAFVLNAGEYGGDVTRKDGSPIRFVEVYDRDQPQERALRMTVGETVDPRDVPPIGSLADLVVTVAVRDGRAKFRVDSIRTAGQNGSGPPQRAQEAAAAAKS